MVAFWVGEFANSFVLAKLKVMTGGKHLWTRTIGSTVVGQGLDSLIFYPLAFYGLAGWPPEQLLQVVLSQWAIKTAWEAALTPASASSSRGSTQRSSSAERTHASTTAIVARLSRPLESGSRPRSIASRS